ncbi:MAG: polysaccharide biosynthesis C-terminal domain-containing protein [Bacteroidales bacterium]|jgi:O-antigen/teichoic acid export membrane protein|nr:polysaccharide biosynthesis C-terminal domain-containing protein [Bacteroidales bacterium]
MGIVVKQSIKGTIITYIGVAIGFITTFFVLTNFLSAEEIGLTRVLVDASVLFAGLAQLGTSASIIRFYPYFKNKEGKDNGFFFWTLVIPFLGFLLFSIIFLILKTPVSNYFSENSALFVDYYYFIFPMAFFMLYMAVFETSSNVLMKIVVPKFVREVLVRLLMLVVYLLFAFKIISLDGLVIGLCAVYAVASIVNIIYVISSGKISLKPNFKYITKRLRKDYIFYTIFLITAALGGAITPFINTFFISGEMGLTYTGIFAIATYIAAIIEIPYRSLGAISQPHISNAIKENNFDEANKLSKKVSLHQFVIGLFLLFIIWINIDLIFKLLPEGQTYAIAKYVVLILCVTRLTYSTLYVGVTILNFSKHYYYSLIFTFILTGVAIILNNYLIPIWGINGAALASLFSYFIYFILLLSLIYFKTKTSPLSINQLKILLIIILMFILNFVWTKTLTPLILSINISELICETIDGILRTGIICFIGIFLTYKLNISDEINNIIDNIVKLGKRK